VARGQEKVSERHLDKGILAGSQVAMLHQLADGGHRFGAQIVRPLHFHGPILTRITWAGVKQRPCRILRWSGPWRCVPANLLL
jgi:hypothetical protein